VEWERFRPNIFVRSVDGFSLEEADFDGKELAVGALRLRVRGPIERCVVTTYDLHAGPPDPRILRFVAQERNAWMGLYCDVIQPGTLRAGDEVATL